MKRTKIAVTMGPAIANVEKLDQLINAGADVIRVNFSHGDRKDRAQDIKLIKNSAKPHRKWVGVLADLQGPKIRIASFKNGKIELRQNEKFYLDKTCDSSEGDQERVNVDYPDLFSEVKEGQKLCLDDGKIILLVKKVSNTIVETVVEVGGVLSSKKGINLIGGGLTAKAITEKDKDDLIAACKVGVDYIALSFVKDASDIELAKDLVIKAGSQAHVLAKIERSEAIDNIDAILAASDGIMVARGDLAIEVGDAKVPLLQKKLIEKAKAASKPVIVATQMMESMIFSPTPTRAEVSDVANAVLDGADAVMLSAESAVGEYPILTVESMNRICVTVEKDRTLQYKTKIPKHWLRIDEAIAAATIYTANHLKIKAIVALTESGRTALWMSSLQVSIPIYGLSRHNNTLGFMSLYRGVIPLYFNATEIPKSQINKEVEKLLKQQKIATDGDFVIITKGDFMGVCGGANAMQILKIGEVV